MKDFSMKRAAIYIGDMCNLKCKLCAVYSPYFPAQSFSVSFLQDTMKKYFEIVTYVEIFTISGGEPLIHSTLADTIKSLDQYVDQIGTLQIITNGTTLPTQNVLKAIKQYSGKFFVLIDNYGDNISIHAKELDSLLTCWEIHHEMRNYTEENPHCGGWVDFGNLKVKKRNTKIELENLYSKCAYPQILEFCFSIFNGIMCPCPTYHKCKEIGVADDYDEYIDLFDSALTVEDQRTKIRNIYNKKSLSACAYCNGLCDDAQRFVPAQQLTPEELVFVKAGARSYAEVMQRMGE